MGRAGYTIKVIENLEIDSHGWFNFYIVYIIEYTRSIMCTASLRLPSVRKYTYMTLYMYTVHTTLHTEQIVRIH